MKKAFSLAEVLITCVIIGAICVLLIPILINSIDKYLVPKQVEKFYANMNQVAMLAKFHHSDCTIKDDMMDNGQGFLNWYDKCLAKYMNNTSKKFTDGVKSGLVVFADGSAFYGYANGETPDHVHLFFCTKYKYCGNEVYDGKHSFLFDFFVDEYRVYASLKGVQTWDRDKLLQMCKYGNWDTSEAGTKDSEQKSSPNKRHTCSRLLEIDDWTIKSDYPWNQVNIETGEEM